MRFVLFAIFAAGVAVLIFAGFVIIAQRLGVTHSNGMYVRCGETEFRDVVMVHPEGDGIVMRMRDGRSVFYTGAELCEWGEAVERGP